MILDQLNAIRQILTDAHLRLQNLDTSAMPRDQIAVLALFKDRLGQALAIAYRFEERITRAEATTRGAPDP
ncbi:MAG: hypothetical protein ACE5KQ_04725 [Thermoplasmata archaeon]